MTEPILEKRVKCRDYIFKWFALANDIDVLHGRHIFNDFNQKYFGKSERAPFNQANTAFLDRQYDQWGKTFHRYIRRFYNIDLKEEFPKLVKKHDNYSMRKA